VKSKQCSITTQTPTQTKEAAKKLREFLRLREMRCEKVLIFLDAKKIPVMRRCAAKCERKNQMSEKFAKIGSIFWQYKSISLQGENC